MKYWMMALQVIAMASSAVSADDKFVGVWEGNYDTPIYTKIVMHDDQTLTYCEVISCRQVNCFKMAFSGTLVSKFAYEDASGKWEFDRIDEEEIVASFVNKAGDVSTTYYEPE